MKKSVSSLHKNLKRLIELRTVFDSGSGDIKLPLICSMAKFANPTIKQLMSYHELLLFMVAYPDSGEIYQKAIEELKRISKTLKKQSTSNKAKKVLEETGMAYSEVTVPPSLSGAAWMIRKLGKDVTAEWDSELIDKIGPQLSLFALPSETDGLTNNHYDAMDWMRIKAGDVKNKQPHLLLQWLVQSVKTTFPVLQQQDQFWEQLAINTRVRLRDPSVSRTLNLLPVTNPFIQNTPLLRTTDIIQYLSEKNIRIVQPDESRTKSILSSDKAALLARGRETDPVTYAEKVTEVILGRGLTVYLLTMHPDRRLPLENYTGFVAYKNGIPVGYGGGWIFGFRCEIGVNIFESFRGGENYLLFAGIMKAYHAVFSVKRFSVAPYQFGEGNPEGIQTGAYWFYYKLGFRSAEKEIAAMAEKEARKMKQHKNYRSSEKTLLRFTESPLYLSIESKYHITEPAVLGICISKWIAAEFQGDNTKALQYSFDSLMKKIPASVYKKWNTSEKQSFRSLAPLICMTGYHLKMTGRATMTLAEMMKEKGNDEIRHTRLLQQNKSLMKAFDAAAKKYI